MAGVLDAQGLPRPAATLAAARPAGAEARARRGRPACGRCWRPTSTTSTGTRWPCCASLVRYPDRGAARRRRPARRPRRVRGPGVPRRRLRPEPGHLRRRRPRASTSRGWCGARPRRTSTSPAGAGRARGRRGGGGSAVPSEAMTDRLVIVGADAAGMSAAMQVRRRQPKREVVVLEKGDFTSYSACGIPYVVGGVVDDIDDLVARTPEEFRGHDIDVRLGHEVRALDLDAGVVEAWDHREGRDGAGRVRPAAPGHGGHAGAPAAARARPALRPRGAEPRRRRPPAAQRRGRPPAEERAVERVGPAGGGGRRRLHRHRDGRGVRPARRRGHPGRGRRRR